MAPIISSEMLCLILSVSDPLSRITLALSALKDTGREAMKMTGVGVSTVLVFDKSTETRRRVPATAETVFSEAGPLNIFQVIHII